MKSLLLAVLLLLAAAPTPLLADELPDTLVLQDGTILRGRVTELIPQTRATIVLFTGEMRVVEWSRVARASGPTFMLDKNGPTVIPPNTYTPPELPETVVRTENIPAPDGAPASERSQITVTVESTLPPHTVRLDQHLTIAPDAAESSPILYVPPPAYPFVPPIALTPPSLSRTLQARSAMSTLIVGGTLSTMGAAFIAVGATEHNPQMGAFRATYLAAGTLTALGGTAALIVGIVKSVRARQGQAVAFSDPTVVRF